MNEKTKFALEFARTVITEALNPENIIYFGDTGAWKDCLNEIDEALNDQP